MELTEQLAQRDVQKKRPHCPRRRHYIDILVYPLRWESVEMVPESLVDSMTDVRTLVTLIQGHIRHQIVILGFSF